MTTPEDVKRFEEINDLFHRPGWKHLLDEMEFKENAIKEGFTQFGVTENLLIYGQGRISVYREFACLPVIIQQALEDSKDNVETPSI